MPCGTAVLVTISNRSNKWLKIMFCLMSAVELVGVKIWYAHVKALEMRMRKLVLGLSLAQVLPKKINKILTPNSLGFIDVNRTVCRKIFFVRSTKSVNCDFIMNPWILNGQDCINFKYTHLNIHLEQRQYKNDSIQ